MTSCVHVYIVLLICVTLICKDVSIVKVLEIKNEISCVKLKRLFPHAKNVNKCTVQRVQVIQTGYSNMILVQVFRDGIYKLKLLLPFAITKNTTDIHTSKHSFKWLTSPSFEKIIIWSNSQINILEKTGKTWTSKRVFDIGNQKGVSVAFSKNEEIEKIMVMSESKVFFIELVCGKYVIKRAKMNYSRIGFKVSPKSLSKTTLITSLPEYKQLDGICDVFNIQGNNFTHKLSIKCPKRASYFGKEVINTDLGHSIISGQFSPSTQYGAGSVYIYDENGVLIQTLTCPDSFTQDIQRTLQFGEHIDTDSAGHWLSISANCAGYGRVYVYKFSERLKRYMFSHSIIPSSPITTHMGKCICLDPTGNVILGTKKGVYFHPAPRRHLSSVS